MAVKFYTEGHRYQSVDIFDDVKWLSASKIPTLFKKPFDPDMPAKCSKSKKSKWFGIPPEEIQAYWTAENVRATTLGTWYHEKEEAKLLGKETIFRYNKELPIFRSIWEDGCKIAPNQKLVDGVYPELLAYLQSLHVCGQFDEVTVCDGYAYVDDHKGLGLEVPIPTKDGFKLMKDIEVGDFIFDGDGNITEVEFVSDIHYNPCYRLTFDTGETVDCDHEHLWITTKRKGKDNCVDEEFTTEQLFNKRAKGQTIRIKNNPGLKLSDIELPIDPYVLGQWLGDGSRCDAGITQMYPKIWEEIEKRGYKLGDNVDSNKESKSQRRNPFGLYTKLRELNLLKNKHIPDIYFRASFNQRLDLLRGFMDSDGYFHRKRLRCVMNTTQAWQAEAISHLVSTLGGKATTMKGKASGFGKTNIDTYITTFKLGDINPFLCRNEDYNLVNKKSFFESYRYILSIEKIETIPTKCLGVKSELKSYLFSKGYIKTHNSNKDLKKPAYVNWEGVSEKMLAPLLHLESTKLNEYALQLSIGMYMVLRHNPLLKPGPMTLNYVSFEIESEDQFGYPIMKLENNEPILKDVEKIEVPYMKREVELMFDFIKRQRQ